MTERGVTTAPLLLSLLARSAQVRFVLARTVWLLWFGWLCFSALNAHTSCEPIRDSTFLQGTGLVSAFALSLTLAPSIRTQRLHCAMLALSCVAFYGLQRPVAYTARGIFLRTLAHIQTGMTTDQVRALLLPYQASDNHYKHQRVFVNSEAAHKWWFHPKYAGRLRFSRDDFDNGGGFYDVTFAEGKVTNVRLRSD